MLALAAALATEGVTHYTADTPATTTTGTPSTACHHAATEGTPAASRAGTLIMVEHNGDSRGVSNNTSYGGGVSTSGGASSSRES
jgi:hypothetical protein